MNEIVNCSEVMTLAVGDREWRYQAFYDDKDVCQVVRFYDDIGEFVTEFRNIEDMREFLSHTDEKKVNAQLDDVRRFRAESGRFLAETAGKNTMDFSISDEEKKANVELFQRRIRMLCGDMNSYEFGKIIGLGGGVTYGIFHNAKYASTNVLKRIAERCNVSADWLLGIK